MSPARTTFLPGRAGPSTCSGFHRSAVGKLDRLAALQASEERSFRDAETLRLLEVEAARARLLDERVPVRRQAVLDGERLDPVVVPRDALSRLQLDERELVAEPPEDAPQDPEEIVEPRGPVDGQRHLAAPERRTSSASPAGRGNGRRGSASGRSREARRARRRSAEAGAASPRRSRRGSALRRGEAACRRARAWRWARSPRFRGRRGRGPQAEFRRARPQVGWRTSRFSDA